MKHINNDFMRIQAQNAMLAQQVAEANKNRQAERARAQSAEELAELQKAEELKEKTVGKVSSDKKGGKDSDRDLRTQRYRKDGTLEDDGPSDFGEKLAKRIDIKI
jgi:hypothetical protein